MEVLRANLSVKEDGNWLFKSKAGTELMSKFSLYLSGGEEWSKTLYLSAKYTKPADSEGINK